MIISPVFDKKSSKPIYMQLYEYIKSEIISGLLKPESKLPSIREASETLNLSKTTIENAYSQLVAEGYIENYEKRGYFVNNLIEYDFKSTAESKKEENEFSSLEIVYLNDGVDSESFDASLWKRIYNKVLTNAGFDIYNSGSTQGEESLRKEVANFVNSMRGGKTSHQQVIIGAGVQYLLGVLAGIIKSRYDSIAVEKPGYTKAEYIFEDYQFKVSHIPIKDNTFPMRALTESGSKVFYTSPSHQYPLGTVMPVNRRMELLEWAYLNDGLIIEDDYDAIIRYDGMPIPCLQGLDKNDCVIYLGSFSKMLLPSLRISFMIIPRKLLPRYKEIKSRYTQSTSKIDQMVLANFMSEGHMAKHIRKIRRVYRKKNELLTRSLLEKFKDRISIINSGSGLHIVCEALTGKSIEKINSDSQKYMVLINIISRSEDKIIFSLNYSGIALNKIHEFTDVLGKILFRE
jgi:GntR family transcriptional regulator/MocR family aminotransferase